MTRNDIQLTFKFFDNNFEKRKLYKLFPEFLEIKNSFKILNDKKYFLDKPYSKIFRQYIDTGVADEKYEVHWNINEAKSYIQNKNISSQKIYINSVYSDRTNLDFRKVEYYEHTMPDIKDIIVVYYFPIDSYLVIDGNHRIEVAKRRELKIVEGFVLSPFAHHQLMSSDLSKFLYAFHHNLIALTNFSKNRNLCKLDINTSLQSKSFYSKNISEDISFTKLKKIRLLLGL